MFEISIFCVFLLVAGYWATLFIMGRHDDVLHGSFVHHEDEPELVPVAPLRVRPPFPARPVKAARTANDAPKLVDSAALQSLLAAIQQDLKDVA